MHTILLLWGKLKHCRTLGQLGEKNLIVKIQFGNI